ncbi:C4-dicarboxylate transporter/malic acid transport protein [Penicillium soppii]|uniref:C4-dicarboxylate transporter/malic acid transport protein n=1 Tax=Penicillium soppii TaxID=69789 RepID=UPI002548ABDA|nr:C4-dicarboxylate transporter/malic acid transport protein [Penicillium soppii]KAJ5863890.1 C4-dicarboxylate transporter/malic acid transport protein [Penicillium soppii]
MVCSGGTLLSLASFILRTLSLGAGKRHSSANLLFDLSMGVFSNSAVKFGNIIGSTAFTVFSTGLLIVLIVMWVVHQILTLKGIVTGHLLSLEHGWGMKASDRQSAEVKEL